MFQTPRQSHNHAFDRHVSSLSSYEKTGQVDYMYPNMANQGMNITPPPTDQKNFNARSAQKMFVTPNHQMYCHDSPGLIMQHHHPKSDMMHSNSPIDSDSIRTPTISVSSQHHSPPTKFTYHQNQQSSASHHESTMNNSPRSQNNFHQMQIIQGNGLIFQQPM